MIPEEIIRSLAIKTESKIILVVMDGLGGIAGQGQSELEAARTPNLDRLARSSALGLADPVAPGITPGSGPGHLAIFGYDPFKYQIGRGVLEALGLGLEMTERDVAARGNFATLSREGLVVDRRAGRIPTEECRRLCARIAEKIPEVNGVKLIIAPGMEHRFALLLRGDGLSDALSDSDPQKEGRKPLPVRPLQPEAEFAAQVANMFIMRAGELLRKEQPANWLLLRGFARYPKIPSMSELFKLTPAVIAIYPMYRGLARLVGMEPLDAGSSLEDEIEALARNYERYDFFFLHYKQTDSRGEDGDFQGKVKAIEELDRFIPRLLELEPDVLAITGDHSTPAPLRGHSWHPTPLLIYSKHCGSSGAERFTERECARGILGRIPATSQMPLMLANALKLKKFGA